MDDLISRQAAIDEANAWLFDCFNVKKQDRSCGLIRRLEDLPSAERHGRWEDIEHAPNGLLYVTCSVCGRRQTVETTNYCGNCGSFNGEGEENAELQR